MSAGAHGERQRRRGALSALIAAALAAGALLVAPGSASALGVSCFTSPPRAAASVKADSGERNHERIGIRHSNGALVFKDTGTTATGDPLFSTECTPSPPNSPWGTISVDLANRNDTLSLGGAGTGTGPVKSSTDVVLRGGAGNDTIHAHKGAGVIDGEGGKDHLFPGGGEDVARGGGGKDVIKAADGQPDVVDCGPGHDKAFVDHKDRVKRCERVRFR